ncbi:hypothetical protein caldi_27410 [Caldinitratiruptor microaerophilus]|uniref:Uncharacterized protein n=1 Tax=Caldinitratiruptor microaerophilus TaxID=671077 RepID=A0AA35G6N9_9FIRM|nr:hypothetical protein caldi_27410 [Caldinitratiruptor microaerophilus]
MERSSRGPAKEHTGSARTGGGGRQLTRWGISEDSAGDPRLLTAVKGSANPGGDAGTKGAG